MDPTAWLGLPLASSTLDSYKPREQRMPKVTGRSKARQQRIKQDKQLAKQTAMLQKAEQALNREKQKAKKEKKWVADLVEMQLYWRENRGVRFLLTVVDVLSKYGWVQPLKHKTGLDMRQAFETILQEVHRPQTLQMDKGKEFYNAPFQKWLKEQGIKHFSTQGDAKAAVVERFNRTLKERLYRYMTAANTTQYLTALEGLVRQYNADEHWAVRRAPNSVTPENEGEVWEHLYGDRLQPTRRRSELKVGDRVRLSKHVCTFKKSYTAQWTEEVFVVQRVICDPVYTYKVEEFDSKGRFECLET